MRTQSKGHPPPLENKGQGTSLVVRGLRLWPPKAGDLGSTSGQETRFYILQVKILSASIKTQHSQINIETHTHTDIQLQNFPSFPSGTLSPWDTDSPRPPAVPGTQPPISISVNLTLASSNVHAQPYPSLCHTMNCSPQAPLPIAFSRQ